MHDIKHVLKVAVSHQSPIHNFVQTANAELILEVLLVINFAHFDHHHLT